MIQNFDVQGGPDFGRKNLPKLRKSMLRMGLDGFLIPHEDEYNNEYLPDCNERLMWTTGFTGSAGAAVVLSDSAAVFVDGRYTLQVTAQVDESLYAYKRLEDSGVTKWLSENVEKGSKIGYDPKSAMILNCTAQMLWRASKKPLRILVEHSKPLIRILLTKPGPIAQHHPRQN